MILSETDTIATKTKGSANDIDRHVGAKIQFQRKIIGMSQASLADALGLTFQQIQKYEKGSNRVGAGRLYEIAKLLKVPVSYFYDGYEGAESSSDNSTFSSYELFHSKEAAGLLKMFYSIEDKQIRKSLMEVMKNIGRQS